MRVRASCESDELVLMVVGPRLKNLDDLETPCPEYPGLRPEYPDRCYTRQVGCVILQSKGDAVCFISYYNGNR